MNVRRFQGNWNEVYESADGRFVLYSDYDALAARLAEFQRLYRGQIANDGSYPDHLFGATDSANHRESPVK